jgi:hypothetical protein
MSQTATSLAAVLKDVWTSDKIQKQFYSDDNPLARFEKVKATMIGKQALVPIHKYGTGGYTSVGSGGGALNAAGAQGVDQAAYTLVYHWQPIELEVSAINQAGGGNLQSVISAKNFEIENAVADMRRQVTRQLVTNGDSIVAQCATGGASTTVSLVASPSGSAYGYDAIQRNWLYPGALIDIGTTSDTDVLLGNTAITSVSEVAATPTITTATSISTTAGTHFVYIANPNSGTAANPEVNGLRNMVNTSGALGGLNPATAGQEFWQAAARDTTTTVFSLDLVLNLQQAVMQKSGKNFTNVWTGLKQQRNFYSLLQNQVRFAGEMKMGAGEIDKPTWNNMVVDARPAFLDSDWWTLTLEDFQLITGSIDKPTWASDMFGSTAPLNWRQGYTSGVDAVAYPMQVGLQRRNTQAGATGLTS